MTTPSEHLLDWQSVQGGQYSEICLSISYRANPFYLSDVTQDLIKMYFLVWLNMGSIDPIILPKIILMGETGLPNSQS